MLLGQQTLFPASLWLLLCLVLGANAADDDFDCHVKLGASQYDLTKLEGLHSLTHNWDSPPSKVSDRFEWNLCQDLEVHGDVKEEDQCPSGTRVCLTRSYQKGEDPDRIYAVVPLAKTPDLRPEYKQLKSPDGLSVVLHGSNYALSNSTAVPQSVAFSLLCSSSSSEPEFVSYNGSQLEVTWSNPSGCSTKGSDTPDKPQEDDTRGGNKSSSGSSIGWFFLVMLLALIAYFALGAYYNYSTYGATGSDLIPHRDFWREVPYMLRDVVSHLCSTFRTRPSSSRGGYIAV
ncbi:hypothetical protein PUNSTDRAFT_50585 [Punctularia strigosozonata HHB-11173 SS5]|uniref:uncharacterized protein n=1 Tax=Punctularia strigosozonata (strain HHB-11173) TaxID=741275 RepID=UPI000441771B|nr:uncharacterized protein PUNSTDRAFT_50585 [Punctularia strigosozonata HHB-11173 SS5]EIN11688.1 hypothetical protein PUNSTDRAFT_50585 [Punctularia strigosozonata HHB-11173 SS5]